jgi:hypothetical protein
MEASVMQDGWIVMMPIKLILGLIGGAVLRLQLVPGLWSPSYTSVGRF